MNERDKSRIHFRRAANARSEEQRITDLFAIARGFDRNNGLMFRPEFLSKRPSTKQLGRAQKIKRWGRF